MSFMGDMSLSNTRQYTMVENSLLSIVAFPQKDDERRRVFREAKLSTCIPVVKRENSPRNARIAIKSYPADSFDDLPMESCPSLEDLLVIDSEFLPIPNRTQAEIDLAVKLHRRSIRLREVAEITRGEINQTIFREFITSKSSHRPLLKGVEIRMFGFNEVLSQGQREYFDERSYESRRSPRRPPERRLALQRITGVDESRRLVCAVSSNGAYFADSTNSVIPLDKGKMLFLDGLLNSSLLNWRFSLTSTNNNVGTNELEMLPYPKEVTGDEVERVVSIVRALQKVGQRRIDEIVGSNLFRQLDSEIYRLYGLKEDEIAKVEGARWQSSGSSEGTEAANSQNGG